MYKQYKQFCWQSILLYEQLSSKADHFGVSSGFMAGKQEGRLVSAAPKRVCRLKHWGYCNIIFDIQAGVVSNARHLAPSALLGGCFR